jgi:hypothetical protein
MKPPVPPKNRSPKGAGSEPKEENPKVTQADNIDEVGDRANPAEYARTDQ